jgi:hypothetical protein
MPLPFLVQEQRPTGIATVYRPSDAKDEDSKDDAGLKAAATDLIEAIHSNDIGKTAAAIRAAFEILDASPHNEGEHLNEENE